jgi:hypothetical protein
MDDLIFELERLEQQLKLLKPRLRVTIRCSQDVTQIEEDLKAIEMELEDLKARCGLDGTPRT